MEKDSHSSVSVVVKDFNFSFLKKKRLSVGRKKPLTESNILKGVNLCVKPGTLLAILGPSGSGKSTLLNCLSGRVKFNSDRTQSSGEILYNGVPIGSDVATFSNYVMQKDQLHEFLSVYETLFICAALKMRKSNEAERRARIEQVIADLSLDACRHVRIGGVIKKGISGGEMKRVAIAIELLDDPAVLFLDEPTSGLDSALAYETISLLLKIAQETGRTVICTVHQPRSQAFSLFQNVLLLRKGEVIFNGPAEVVTDYFANLGYTCPPNFNPADYILDLISQKMPTVYVSNKSMNEELEMPTSHATVDGKSVSRSSSVVEPLKHKISKKVSQCIRLTHGQVDKLSGDYKESNLYESLQAEISEIVKSPKIGVNKKSQFNKLKLVSPWFKQFRWIWYRSTLNTLRNPIISYAQYVVNILLGAMLGGIFWQVESDNSPDTVVARNISGLLFFLAINFSFSAFDAILSFPDDRFQFNRECASGMYSSSAYFWGKTLAELPFQQIPPIVQMILVYWMAGLRTSASAFFMFILFCSLAVFAAVGILYLIGSLSPNGLVANLVAPLILIICMLVSGFYRDDNSIPGWINWLKYVVPMRYVYFGLVLNQFPSGFRNLTQKELYELLGVTDSSLWSIGLITFALGAGYRMAAMFGVRFCHRRSGME